MNTQKHPSASDPEKEKPSSALDLPTNPPTTKVSLSSSEKGETILQLLAQQKKTMPSQSTLHSSVRGEKSSVLMSKMSHIFSQERYQPLEMLTQKGSENWQKILDSWLDRKVLRKQVQINATDKNSTIAFERLKREAQITSVLEHPNIVPLHDIQQDKSEAISFTLRTMDGETLFDFFQKKRLVSEALEESFFLGIFLKVCDAIAYAHSRSIAHGSLNPSCIWIGHFGEVYVGDWGASKYFHETGQPAKDIEALGKILRQGFLGISSEEESEMMTAGSSRRQLAHWIRGRIPFDLQWIIYKAIEEDKKKRYPAIQDFVTDIERYQKNLRVSSRKYTREELLSKWMQRNSRVIKVGSFIAIVVFLLLLYFQWLRIEDRKKTFRLACEQAREHLLAAEKTSDQNTKNSLFFSAFHQFRIALSIEPEEKTERERDEFGRKILTEAYQNQDYALAQYIIQELRTSNFLSLEEKDALSKEMTEKQLKISREHLQKVEEWLRVLKNSRQTDLLRKEALLEICKMKEDEVFLLLKQHFEEGTQYFLSNIRNTRRDEFYGTVALILGYLGNRKAIDSFVLAMEQLSTKLSSTSQDVAYLILLTQGLIHLKPIEPELMQRLRKIREQLGDNNLYTQPFASFVEALEKEQ